MTREEEIQRAETAKQILKNPLVTEALDAIETATMNKLRSAEKDEDKLKLLDFLHAASLFRRYFESHIETGKLAQQAMSTEDTLMGRLRRVF